MDKPSNRKKRKTLKKVENQRAVDALDSIIELREATKLLNDDYSEVEYSGEAKLNDAEIIDDKDVKKYAQIHSSNSMGELGGKNIKTVDPVDCNGGASKKLKKH